MDFKNLMKPIWICRFTALLCAAIFIFSPAFAQPKPQLILQGAGMYQFRGLAVSNGGRWLVSTDHNGSSTRVWDAKSGLLWGQWSDDATPLLFSPDGKSVLVHGVKTNAIELRAMPSGKSLRAFPLTAPLFFDAKIIQGLQGNTLVSYSVQSGKATRKVKLDGGLSGFDRSSASLSPNARTLIISGVQNKKNVARVWDAQGGKIIRTVSGERAVMGRSAVSSDGKWLATQGENPTWQPPNGSATESAYARQLTIKLWNRQTGKIVRSWPGHYSLDGGVLWLRFSNDSRFLLSAGSEHVDVWNVQNGKSASRPGQNKDRRESLSWPFAISPDGFWLAGQGSISGSSSYAPGLRLAKVMSGQITQRFSGPLRGAAQVQWSPDGKRLMGGERLVIWDAKTGKLLSDQPRSYLRDLNGSNQSSPQPKPVVRPVPQPITPGGKAPEDTKQKRDPFADYSGGKSISPDGKILLTAALDGEGDALYVWDAATKKPLRRIEKFGNQFHLDDVLWLPDSRRIVRGIQSGMELWNIHSGLRERAWRDPVDPLFEGDYAGDDALMPISISADGKKLAVHANRNKVLLVYDLESGKLQRTILTRNAFKVRFAPAGKSIWIFGERGLELWALDGDSVQPARVLGDAHGKNFSFSPDQKLVALAGDNGVEIWNVAKSVKVLTLLLLGGTSDEASSEWIALTPDGFYDASPAGEARLRWRQNDLFWPIAKSRAQFHRPDLVQKALRGE